MPQVVWQRETSEKKKIFHDSVGELTHCANNLLCVQNSQAVWFANNVCIRSSLLVCTISPIHPSCDSFYSPLFSFSPSVSPRPPHPASYLENLLAKARHISVQLPSKSLLVDTLDRAAQWKKQAQQLQVY